jgi:rhodanese-related sulfurtransferase
MFAFAAVLGLTGAAAGCSSTPSTHQDVATFTKTIATPGVVLVDVRTAAEYAAGHIANAQNIDVDGADFAQQIGALDKAASYALYCHSGRRSGNALTIMQDAGFTHVVDLDGGIQTWTAAGSPLVTS